MTAPTERQVQFPGQHIVTGGQSSQLRPDHPHFQQGQIFTYPSWEKIHIQLRDRLTFDLQVMKTPPSSSSSDVQFGFGVPQKSFPPHVKHGGGCVMFGAFAA